MQLTPEQLHTLNHSLGMDRCYEPYRNIFMASPEGDPTCDSLVALGLMEKGQKRPGLTDLQPYFVTDEGEKVALAHRAKLSWFECTTGDDWKYASYYRAATRSKARYLHFLSIGDCCPDIRFQDIKVRRAA